MIDLVYRAGILSRMLLARAAISSNPLTLPLLTYLVRAFRTAFGSTDNCWASKSSSAVYSRESLIARSSLVLAWWQVSQITWRFSSPQKRRWMYVFQSMNPSLVEMTGSMWSTEIFVDLVQVSQTLHRYWTAGRLAREPSLLYLGTSLRTLCRHALMSGERAKSLRRAPLIDAFWLNGFGFLSAIQPAS